MFVELHEHEGSPEKSAVVAPKCATKCKPYIELSTELHRILFSQKRKGENRCHNHFRPCYAAGELAFNTS